MSGVIKISCLRDVEGVCMAWRPTHVISLLDPHTVPPVIDGAKHTICFFYDQERNEHVEIFESAMQSIENFILELPRDGSARVLIHCHAGVSRSTAVAYVVLSALSPQLASNDAFHHLLMLANKPWPNRRIVDCLQGGLSIESDLLEPLDAYRKLHPKRLAAYRILNGRRGLHSKVLR